MPNPFSTQTPLPTPPVMPGQGAGPMGAPPPDPMAAMGGAPPIADPTMGLPPAPPPATQQDPSQPGFIPPMSGMGSMGGIDRNRLAQLIAQTGGGAMPASPAPPMGGMPPAY